MPFYMKAKNPFIKYRRPKTPVAFIPIKPD
jgi:hypothetical protein